MTMITERTGALRATQLVGACLLGVVVLFALLVPMFAGDPLRQNLDHTLGAPTFQQPMGTDHLGRSVLARLGAAARLSLTLAVVTVIVAAAAGTTAGIAAAWAGGLVDKLLVAIADGVLAVPGLLLVVLFAAIAPGRLWPFYIGLSLAFWVEYFRVVRASSRTILAGSDVEASRLLGFGRAYLIRRHLLPEIAPLLATLMTFGVTTAIVSLATMGFVGVGLRPPTPELGLMMIEFLPHYREAPWLIAGPIGVLVMTVVALGLLGGAHNR